jgi:alpha-beta hydrolase superfamily lysophospholipase
LLAIRCDADSQSNCGRDDRPADSRRNLAIARTPVVPEATRADPLRGGFPFTTRLAMDLLDALPYLSSPASLEPIRKDMPIYVFSGERDPVGANIQGLIDALKAAGSMRLTTRIYPGARHETLNETNRDEVTRDLIAWLDGVAGS